MTFGPTGPPLRFTVDGEPYTLTGPGGADLAEAAAVSDWTALVPYGLDDGSLRMLDRRLADPHDRLDLAWCRYIAEHLGGEMLGVPWHVGGRLAATAMQQWDLFDGWCVSVGFDPQQAGAHRIMSAALQWARVSCSGEREWRRVEQQLYAPPESRARQPSHVPLWGGGEESRLFQQAMQDLGSG